MLQMETAALLLVILSCMLLSESNATNENKQSARNFPDGFLFGAATASYQVEGGWNADGKGENIWDRLTHTNPCAVADCQNGDIANDSYNKYKRDVEMLRELGLDMYRFSLSWSRILPTGFPDRISKAGVQYYNNLINELLKYNIKPSVTIFHWDLPQKLQDLGGLANPLIVDWYSDYARVVYEQFGDRVKHWVTFNEPISICHHGYGGVNFAPQLNSNGIGEYICAKNLLVAHAKAYHLYDKGFKPMQGGQVGITIYSNWNQPDTTKDIELADVLQQFETGIYAHPIYSEKGDWPPVMKERVAAKSAAQGFTRSRLPEFTHEEVELIQGSADFFGLNHYTTFLVYKNQSVVNAIPSYEDDNGASVYQSSEWNSAASSWLKDNASGFYNLLALIRKEYNNPPVYITESGFSTYGGLEDNDRVTYLRGYINAMLDAIEEGSDVRAYFAWSLMDNFEWLRGYTERFGLYEVDYTNPERTRTPRKSAFVYKEIVRTRALDPHYEPDTTHMTIDEAH